MCMYIHICLGGGFLLFNFVLESMAGACGLLDGGFLAVNTTRGRIFFFLTIPLLASYLWYTSPSTLHTTTTQDTISLSLYSR